MVNPSVITKRVEQIEKHLERIRPFASLSREAFLKDTVAQDVVEYNLFQIVNHLVGIFQHTVVDEEYGFPETAYEAGQILFEKGILSKEDVEGFKQMVGFRNVVGHDYINVDKEIVYNILIHGEKDTRTLLTRIVSRFL
ncbi:MAG: DUF86 domain-containing protein [Deltaproteobacteria bacterium]